jgi:hypothetical protein
MVTNQAISEYRAILFAYAVLVLLGGINGQDTTRHSLLWQRTIGGSGFDSLVTTCDQVGGGRLLAWSTTSCDGWVPFCSGKRDIVLTSLSTEGAVLWQWVIGGKGNDDPLLLTRDNNHYFLYFKSSSAHVFASRGQQGGIPFNIDSGNEEERPMGREVIGLLVVDALGGLVKTQTLPPLSSGSQFVPSKVLFNHNGGGVTILAHQQERPEIEKHTQNGIHSALYFFDHNGEIVRSMHLLGATGDMKVHSALMATSSGDPILDVSGESFYGKKTRTPKHFIYLYGNKSAEAQPPAVIMEGDRAVDIRSKVVDLDKLPNQTNNGSDLFVMCLNEQWVVQWFRQYPTESNEYALEFEVNKWLEDGLLLLYRIPSSTSNAVQSVSPERQHLESNNASGDQNELQVGLIDRKGLWLNVKSVEKSMNIKRSTRMHIRTAFGFSSGDPRHSDEIYNFFASGVNPKAVGSLQSKRIDHKGFDLRLLSDDESPYWCLAQRDGKTYIASLEHISHEVILPGETYLLPKSAQDLFLSQRSFSFVRGLSGFAKPMNGDFVVSAISWDPTMFQLKKFDDQVSVQGWWLPTVEVDASRTDRIQTLLNVWNPKKDWRTTARAAFALEGSNDYAAASYYYGIAHAAAKTTGTVDSLSTLRAHQLACQFFSKTESATQPVRSSSDGNGTTNIGVLLARSTDKIIVVDVFKGSGAEQAGIWPGDQITHIGGINVSSIASMDTITARLTGPVGQDIEIRTERAGRKEPKLLKVNLRLPTIVTPKGEDITTPRTPTLSRKSLDYNAELVNDYAARDQAKFATLDSSFKEVSKWSTVTRNTALLQRVNSCLEILNRMAKGPVDDKSFQDVDLGLGLIGVLAQVVAESGQRTEQLGGLRTMNTTLTELSKNTASTSKAEAVVPLPNQTMESGRSEQVELEGGTVVVSVNTDSDDNISGRYECILCHYSTTISMPSGPHTTYNDKCTKTDEITETVVAGGMTTTHMSNTLTILQIGNEIEFTGENSTTSTTTGPYGTSFSGGSRLKMTGVLVGNVVKFDKHEFIGFGGHSSMNQWTFSFPLYEMIVQTDGTLILRFRQEISYNSNGGNSKQITEGESTIKRIP